MPPPKRPQPQMHQADMDMDPDDRQWVMERERAREKQLRMKKPITEAEFDAQKKAHSEAQAQAARLRATTPGTLTGESKDPWDIDTKISLPPVVHDVGGIGPVGNNAAAVLPAAGPVSAGNSPNVTLRTAPPNVIVIWYCKTESGTDIYASSWDAIKLRLKSLDGFHLVKEYTLSNNVDNIINFFQPNPEIKLQGESKSFDIIVKGGKVFRDES